MKKISALIAGLLFSAGAFAQGTSEPVTSFWSDPVNYPMTPIYVITAFIFVVILLVAAVAIYLIRILNMLTAQAEKEKAEKAGVPVVTKPGWWSSLLQQMNASVPVDEEKNIELEHNYDGIRELDNHLPPWWKWLFYGTIGWGVVYIIVFHFSASLPLQLQEYENEVAQADEQVRQFKASQPQAAIDEASLVFTNDATIIEKGKAVFSNNNCASCHRSDGGGNTIGPNLTDAYWLHGGDIKQVFNTVKNGVVEKGMPAWGKALSPQDVRDVSFFILSLQGTNPKDAKGPQGELFKPQQSATSAADTLNAQALLN